MYAVIQSGGKQVKAQLGDIIQVEKLSGEEGQTIELNEVLFAAQPGAETSQVWLGKPVLAGAKVSCEVVAQGRGDKILIIKMKRRKQYRRTQGHRQEYTQLIVTGINNGAGNVVELSATDKAAKLGQFHTQLKAKGPAATTKNRLGARKKAAQAAS